MRQSSLHGRKNDGRRIGLAQEHLLHLRPLQQTTRIDHSLRKRRRNILQILLREEFRTKRLRLRRGCWNAQHAAVKRPTRTLTLGTRFHECFCVAINLPSLDQTNWLEFGTIPLSAKIQRRFHLCFHIFYLVQVLIKGKRLYFIFIIFYPKTLSTSRFTLRGRVWDFRNSCLSRTFFLWFLFCIFLILLFLWGHRPYQFYVKVIFSFVKF